MSYQRRCLKNAALGPNDPSQLKGVSAVKALAIAAEQGQKIFTLNQANHAIHGTILQGLQISQDVKLEIAEALEVGREVILHEKDINVNGWVGSGYIILDPANGMGAYKIDGGSNGGFVLGAYYGAMFVMELQLLKTSPTFGPAVAEAALWVLLPYLVFCASYLTTLSILYPQDKDLIFGCFLGGVLAPISVLAYPGSPVATATQWIDYIAGQIGWTYYSAPTARECGVL